jgi:hypothetical protein
MHLVLAAGLSGVSASDVARIAGDRLAWRSAVSIHISCQKAAASRQAVYPYTGFPFEGDTNLSVTGVWLPFGDGPESTFLAYQLRSCSHAFLFRSLSYEALRYDNQSARNPGRGSDTKNVRHFDRISTRPKTVDDDPCARKAQRSRGFTTKNRFPDLLRKPIWKEKIECFGSTNVFLMCADGSIEQVAFGEPGGSTEAAGIDATTQPETGTLSLKQHPLPHFVRRALTQIRCEIVGNDNSDTALQIIRPKGMSVSVFFLPIVVDKDGELLPELMFVGEAGRVRQRRACFAEFVKRGKVRQCFAIVEERDTQSTVSVMEMDEPSIHGLMHNLLGLLKRSMVKRACDYEG